MCVSALINWCVCARACVRACVFKTQTCVRAHARAQSCATPLVYPLRNLSRVNDHYVNPVVVLKKKRAAKQMVRWKLMMGWGVISDDAGWHQKCWEVQAPLRWCAAEGRLSWVRLSDGKWGGLNYNTLLCVMSSVYARALWSCYHLTWSRLADALLTKGTYRDSMMSEQQVKGAGLLVQGRSTVGFGFRRGVK